MAIPELVLVTGKGGTGKTTAAAALALALAQRSRAATLVSLDPAHNLGDVLDCTLGDEPREVRADLLALEVDLQARVQRRMRSTRRLVEERYRYLSVANLDPLIRLLGEAPGAQEQAAVEELGEQLAAARAAGRTLIVDLPPSGQAWRLLALPELSVRWCEALVGLRHKLLDRRATLQHVLGEEALAAPGAPAPEPPGRDPVLPRLEAARATHRELAAALVDPAVAAVLAIALPERLALLETRRLADHLREYRIPLAGLILNRCEAQDLRREPFDAAFAGLASATLPALAEEPRGQEQLRPLGERLLALFGEG